MTEFFSKTWEVVTLSESFCVDENVYNLLSTCLDNSQIFRDVRLCVLIHFDLFYNVGGDFP